MPVFSQIQSARVIDVDLPRSRTTTSQGRKQARREARMKYLCLIYHDEAKINALPQAEYDDIMRDVFEYRDELRQSGHYVMSSPLQPVGTAVTVQVRSGNLNVTDGPYAETREQLGGFYLIEARDLNEAIRLTEKMPPARFATIEVRALNEVGPD